MVRKSKFTQMLKKLQNLRRQRFKSSIKPPWTCPWCWDESMNPIKAEPMIFIYCGKCDKGEVMPLHDAWKLVDYYCFVVDNVLEGAEPVFKYLEMDFDTYMFLNKNISLGKLDVGRIVQRGEKKDDEETSGEDTV